MFFSIFYKENVTKRKYDGIYLVRFFIIIYILHVYISIYTLHFMVYGLKWLDSISNKKCPLRKSIVLVVTLNLCPVCMLFSYNHINSV